MGLFEIWIVVIHVLDVNVEVGKWASLSHATIVES